jgi:VanZ family protein
METPDGLKAPELSNRGSEKRLEWNRGVVGPLIGKTVESLCLLVLCIVLTAGLWPFHAPRNEVAWLQSGNGLRFGRHGTAYSNEAFRAVRVQDPDCSLELWLQPDSVGVEGTIVAFDSSADRSWPFALRQHRRALSVRRYMIDEKGVVRRPGLWLDDVFVKGEPTFIALTSKDRQNTIYVNGVPIERSSSLGFACKDLIGRVVLANSTVDDSWSGQLMGLAVYDTTLTSQQVEEQFETWTPDKGPALADKESPVALYLFNESSGTVAHDRIGSGVDLAIPTRYSVLHPGFLRPVWSQQSYYAMRPWTRWSYWWDIAVNIFGFIPLGFLFLAYFSVVKQIQKSAMLVVTLGFAISLTIEVAQRFLPTRDSGMMDLITNTLGTFLGVVLFRFSIAGGPAGKMLVRCKQSTLARVP